MEENEQSVSPYQMSVINNVLVGRDGTEWTPVAAGISSRGRSLQQNILKECPGATSYAKRYIKTNSPASAWRLLIDKFILEHIRSCTIAEAQRQSSSKDFNVTMEELEAFYQYYVTGSEGKQ